MLALKRARAQEEQPALPRLASVGARVDQMDGGKGFGHIPSNLRTHRAVQTCAGGGRGHLRAGGSWGERLGCGGAHRRRLRVIQARVHARRRVKARLCPREAALDVQRQLPVVRVQGRCEQQLLGEVGQSQQLEGCCRVGMAGRWLVSEGPRQWGGAGGRRKAQSGAGRRRKAQERWRRGTGRAEMLCASSWSPNLCTAS